MLLLDKVDVTSAKVISREVSDGVIARGYDEEALQILPKKKRSKHLVLRIDEVYEPGSIEARTVYEINLTQGRNDFVVNPKETFNNIRVPKDSPPLPESAPRHPTVATVASKFTQSNSIC